MLLEGATLALLIAASPGEAGPGTGPDVRAELEACAERIEELKARRRQGEAIGRELERLLVRAQELAAQLDQAAAELPTVPRAPSPEELRERADAARDEADRLSGEIVLLDVKIGDLRRILRSEEGGPMAHAALGGQSNVSPRGAARLRELLWTRAALAERRAIAEAGAARLEREASGAEADH